MKRDSKIILLACISVLFITLSIMLLTTHYQTYAILTFTVSIVLITYTILYYNETKDIYSIYKNELKRIQNTYDSILVKSNTLPELKNHNIIKVASMEDLVYAQMLIKKPIYFYEEEKNCSFVLIDDKEICVYILKANEEIACTTDAVINEIRAKIQQEEKDIDHSILDDIENTTIIKLDNHKTYKVSPIKPKNTMKDATQVLDIVNEVKEALEKEKKAFNGQNFEEEINLKEVEAAIDQVVQLSNTGVLNLIKSEPLNNEKIKNIVEYQKIEIKEEKETPKKVEKKESKTKKEVTVKKEEPLKIEETKNVEKTKKVEEKINEVKTKKVEEPKKEIVKKDTKKKQTKATKQTTPKKKTTPKNNNKKTVKKTKTPLKK